MTAPTPTRPMMTPSFIHERIPTPFESGTKDEDVAMDDTTPRSLSPSCTPLPQPSYAVPPIVPDGLNPADLVMALTQELRSMRNEMQSLQGQVNEYHRTAEISAPPTFVTKIARTEPRPLREPAVDYYPRFPQEPVSVYQTMTVAPTMDNGYGHSSQLPYPNGGSLPPNPPPSRS